MLTVADLDLVFGHLHIPAYHVVSRDTLHLASQRTHPCRLGRELRPRTLLSYGIKYLGDDVGSRKESRLLLTTGIFLCSLLHTPGRPVMAYTVH